MLRKLSPEIETAWAAGFYEGEGCVVTARGHLMLSVAQVSREPLDRFAAWARTGGVSVAREGAIHVYRASGLQAQRLLMSMWPHLSQRRRDQALNALLGFVMRRVRPTGCQRGHVDAGFYVAPNGGRECLLCRAERRRGPAKPFLRARAIESRIGVREYSPPNTRTAQAAVAWTFDIPARDYAPAVET